MFCPSCGVKEDRPVQFCRSCGTDIRTVRDSTEQPAAVATSNAAARQEIARAIASRIEAGEWWQVGAMVPQVQQLFESPEERRSRLQRKDEQQRLRRLRAGTVTAAVGLGSILLFILSSVIINRHIALAIGPSLVVFLIGLGVIINGLFFTIPKRAPGGRQEKPDREMTPRAPAAAITDGQMSSPPLSPPSVVEHTTQHLSGEPDVAPR